MVRDLNAWDRLFLRTEEFDDVGKKVELQFKVNGIESVNGIELKKFYRDEFVNYVNVENMEEDK